MIVAVVRPERLKEVGDSLKASEFRLSLNSASGAAESKEGSP